MTKSKFLFFFIFLFCFCYRKIIVNKLQIPPVNIITDEEKNRRGIGFYYSDYYLYSGYDENIEYYVVNKLDKGAYFQLTPINHLSLASPLPNNHSFV